LEVSKRDVGVSVFSKSWLAFKRGQIVFDIWGRRVSGGNWLYGALRAVERFVNVFTLVAIVVWWHFFNSILDFLFGSSIVFQIFWDFKDRQVLVHFIEKHSLNLEKELVTIFADKPVVVLIFYVDDELHVASLSAAGETLHGGDFDTTLELLFLYIAELVGS